MTKPLICSCCQTTPGTLLTLLPTAADPALCCTMLKQKKNVQVERLSKPPRDTLPYWPVLALAAPSLSLIPSASKVALKLSVRANTCREGFCIDKNAFHTVFILL